MNSETSTPTASLSSTGTGLNGTSGTNNTSSASGTIQRVAQKAHETVDKLQETAVSSSDRVMSMQEEYGSYARDHIKAHPLSTVAGAFAIGLLLGKILR